MSPISNSQSVTIVFPLSFWRRQPNNSMVKGMNLGIKLTVQTLVSDFAHVIYLPCTLFFSSRKGGY